MRNETKRKNHDEERGQLSFRLCILVGCLPSSSSSGSSSSGGGGVVVVRGVCRNSIRSFCRAAISYFLPALPLLLLKHQQ